MTKCLGDEVDRKQFPVNIRYKVCTSCNCEFERENSLKQSNTPVANF